MTEDKHNEKCVCAFCGNNNFKIPDEIIEAIKNENLIIFAGAGISTEGKNVYKTTLYTEINDELEENYDNTFPQLMTKYCNQPNGRRKLINKINERFDYYKSFPEVDNVMNLFFSPLADIYSIKDIITTNWDRQFEEKCNCVPIVYDKDIPLIDDKKRKVYKIHGSIDNIGTLIMTEDDYEKCYSELNENLIGSKLKELLSRKTVVFIGYSLEDDDFKKIWKFIDEKLDELKPHFYIVSPDESMKEKLSDKNVTVINTLGSNFIEKIRRQLINDKFLLNSDILYIVATNLYYLCLKAHRDTNNLIKERKEPLLIYSILYQDGLIHSLERILARKTSGEYLNPAFIFNSIDTYSNILKKYLKEGNIFDGSYIAGYLHAMDYIFYLYNVVYSKEDADEDEYEKIYLYYLPLKNEYNNLEEFENDLKAYKTKKYINIANKIIKDMGNDNYELEIHHLPFL